MLGGTCLLPRSTSRYQLLEDQNELLITEYYK